MARAQAHLSAGRHAEAIGAFRAALGIDPNDMRARLGLVKALVARGRRSDAAEGLAVAARTCMGRKELDLALDLLGRALELDPHRLELHVDVAMVERSMGRTEHALMRIEGLAEHYMSSGRTEDAAQLLRFVASWDQPARVTVVPVVVEAAAVPKAAPADPTAPLRSKSPRRLPERAQPAARRAEPPSAPPRVDENDRTVARAMPRVANEDIDVDMVTRVARMPERATKPARPIVVGKPARPIVDTRPAQPIAVARAAARPIAETTTTPIVTTRSIAKPSARPVAKAIVGREPVSATRSETSGRGVPSRAARSNVTATSSLVDRLRNRAGLGLEDETPARPPKARASRGARPRVAERAVRDDEVTVLFRRPEDLQHAIAH